MPVRLFLCGDVMTGRGIDQVLAHPGKPDLFESYMRSAVGYVQLAERVAGFIGRGLDFAYPWGEALAVLRERRPDARIINLETAVTASDDAQPGKGIHYRMHPDNLPCITSAEIDCCVLANNHVMDWGRAGLAQTLSVLHAAGLRTAGAGRDAQEAGAPAVMELPAGRGQGPRFCLRDADQRHSRRLGRNPRAQRSQLPGRVVRPDCGACRRSDAPAPAGRRRRRGVSALGRKLGVRHPARGAGVCAWAHSCRRRRHRLRPFLSPRQRHRGPSGQADSLRVRRFPE